VRKLGLIGGLAAGATVQYYRELVRLGAGEMLIIHADVTRVMRDVEHNNQTALGEYFADLIERLAGGGAEVAAISAIAPHICIRELEKLSRLPLVNIIHEVGAAIRARGLQTVGLLGTRFVMETRMYGMLEGVEIVVPEEIETIHEIYMRIVKGDIGGKTVLERIAQKLPVDAVVMAGTDLSVAFNETNTPFPHVDCLKVHTAAIIRELQSEPA
jgi:aspartate racemase